MTTPNLFLALYASGIFDRTPVADHYNLVDVSYAGAPGTFKGTMETSVSRVIAGINGRAGPFALAGMSYGAWVCKMVLDEIRTGSLQSRQADFLGAIVAGNPAREAGHTLPGIANAIDPGGHGILDADARLVDSPDNWFEFAAPGDLIAVNGDDAISLLASSVFDYLYGNPAAGARDYSAALAKFAGQSTWSIAAQLWRGVIEGMTWVIPHMNYMSYKPITGDPRTSMQVAAAQLLEFVSVTITDPILLGTGQSFGPVVSGVTPQNYLTQISVTLNQLGNRYMMDSRFAAAATTLGVVAAEWTANPIQAGVDLNTLVAQLSALLYSYPTDSNLNNAMGAAQQLYGAFTGST